MQRPPNKSLLSRVSAGLLAVCLALIGLSSAPAMAAPVSTMIADTAPQLGVLSSDVTAIDLAAQPPGYAIQTMDMTFVHNIVLLPAGADTEFISAVTASPDNQLLRLDGHVFDDWPVIGAQ